MMRSGARLGLATHVRAGLVLIGIPLVAVLAASTQQTSSYLYDVKTYAGGISSGSWDGAPDVPKACVSGDPLDLLTAMDVAGWDVIRLREGQTPEVPGAVLTPPSTLDLTRTDKQPPRPGYLVVVESGSWTVIGSKGQDIMLGGPDENRFQGYNGDDCLIGGSGANYFGIGGGQSGENHRDVFIGGSGDNHFWTGNAKDVLIGGTGNNVLESGNAPDTLYGGPGPGLNRLVGGHAPDLCWSSVGGVVSLGACFDAAAPERQSPEAARGLEPQSSPGVVGGTASSTDGDSGGSSVPATGSQGDLTPASTMPGEDLSDPADQPIAPSADTAAGDLDGSAPAVAENDGSDGAGR